MVDKKTGLKPKAKSTKLKAASKVAKPKNDELKTKPKAEKTNKPKRSAKKTVLAEDKTAAADIETDLTTPLRMAETAKAGRRSAKAEREKELELAKEARKAEAEAKGEKPKIPVKPPRSRVERAGKKYREAAKLIDKTKAYSLDEGVDLALKTNPVKFDATLEIHLNLNVDPKQADQNVRGTLVLPAGSGKTSKVAAFIDDAEVEEAKAAGADVAGVSTIIDMLDKEQLDFDVLIATPMLMAQLGKYAKILGPKGLMPNPKSGTVTNDVTAAIKEAKAGKVEYRVDSAGIIHLGIGKVSFGALKLQQNAAAVISNVKSAKPASVKGAFISSTYLTTSMGPSIKVAT